MSNGAGDTCSVMACFASALVSFFFSLAEIEVMQRLLQADIEALGTNAVKCPLIIM